MTKPPRTPDEALPSGEPEVEDVATLDVDATIDEVVAAVHWIEDHVPGMSSEATGTGEAEEADAVPLSAATATSSTQSPPPRET